MINDYLKIYLKTPRNIYDFQSQTNVSVRECMMRDLSIGFVLKLQLDV